MAISLTIDGAQVALKKGSMAECVRSNGVAIGQIAQRTEQEPAPHE